MNKIIIKQILVISAFVAALVLAENFNRLFNYLSFDLNLSRAREGTRTIGKSGDLLDSQWASSATASSELDEKWRATNILGDDADYNCSLFQTGNDWRPADTGKEETITGRFTKAVQATRIDIYTKQGYVSQVEVLDPGGQWHTIRSKEYLPHRLYDCISEIKFARLPFVTKEIRITVPAGSQTAISAIRLYGDKTGRDGSIVFQDDFESDLNAWTDSVSKNGAAIVGGNRPVSGSKMVYFNYVSSGQRPSIGKKFSPVQGRFSIWLWDSKQEPLGTMAGIRLGGNYDTLSGTPGVYDLWAGVRTDAPTGSKDTASKDHYLIRINNRAYVSLVARSRGWHLFEFVATPEGAYVIIDGQNTLKGFPDKRDPWPQARGHIDTTLLNPDIKSFDTIYLFSAWNLHGEAWYDGAQVVSEPAPSEAEMVDAVLDNYLELYATTVIPPAVLPGTPASNQGLEQYKPWLALARAAAWQRKLQEQDLTAAQIVHYRRFLQENLSYALDQYDVWKDVPMWYVMSYPLGLVSWLNWDNLSSALRERVVQQVSESADKNVRLFQQQVTDNSFINGYRCDSKGESNSWQAASLGMAASMLGDHPRAAIWSQYADYWAYHSTTTKDSPVYGNLKTVVLYPDYTMENHDRVNPVTKTVACNNPPLVGYQSYPNMFYAMTTLHHLGVGELAYRLVGRVAPTGFRHNIESIWRANVLNLINPEQLRYTPGEAWAFDWDEGPEAVLGGAEFYRQAVKPNELLVSALIRRKYYLDRDNLAQDIGQDRVAVLGTDFTMNLNANMFFYWWAAELWRDPPSLIAVALPE